MTLVLQLVLCLLVGLAICSHGAQTRDKFVDLDTTSHNQTIKRDWTDIKHLFVFGDSYSTTGWNPWGPLPSSQNPLGNPTLPGNNLCNCKSWISLLSTDYAAAPMRTYNFARNCASIAKVGRDRCSDPNLLNMEDQLNTYWDFLRRPGVTSGMTSVNSLFVSWFGINDVHFLSQYSDQVIDSNMDILMNIYMGFLDALYAQSARNFLILGIPRIDLTPMVFLQRGNPRSTSTKKHATLRTFNWKLTMRLQSWQNTHSDAKVILVDTDPMTYHMLEFPTTVGAKEDMTCIDRRDEGVCLWADEFHPSGRVHREIARQVANQVVEEGLQGFFRPT